MEDIKTLDKRYLALGDYQMLDKWIPVEDANPKDFGLDWVLIKYTEKINFGERFCTPDVAEKRKDGLWHKKGYFYEGSIKDFNQNYKVKYWRPIDGYLPKRTNSIEEKAIETACKCVCSNCKDSSGCDGNSPYTCPIIQSIENVMKNDFSKLPKQTNYQVFEVNDCFEEYAISYNLVGAIDENDLVEHLYEVGKELNLTKKQVKNIIKDKDWRIKRIEHLFTDTPYVILNSVGYME